MCVWVRHWSFTTPAAAPALDPSYEQALGVALRRGLQWGSDIVFTYGPLGWFHGAPYDRELFWTKCLAWELALGAWVAAVLASAWFHLRGPIERGVLAFLLVVPATWQDARGPLALLAATFLLLPRVEARAATRIGPRSWASFAFIAVPMGLLAVVKFTWFVQWALCASFLAGAWGASRGWRSACAATAITVGGLLCAWLLAGQSLLGFGAWVTSSLELTSGYADAMSGPSRPIVACAGWGAWLASFGVAILVVCEQPRARIGWLAAILLVLSTWLALRTGFVRARNTEVASLLFLGAAPFLLAGSTQSTRWTSHLARVRCSAALAALVGLHALPVSGVDQPVDLLCTAARAGAEHLGQVVRLPHLRREREAELVRLESACALPRTRAVVGDAGVDVLGHEQAIVFLNGLAWRPRPVFQAYAAYTPALSERNAGFLEGASAPQFVLHSASTILERAPGLDDARSLDVLLRRYEPLFFESGFLLWRRRQSAASDRLAVSHVATRTIAFGERVELPCSGGSRVRVQVRASDTLGERLASWLRTPPSWFLEVELADDEGARERRRLLRAVAADGFWIEPWLPDLDAWRRWLGGGSLPRVRAFRVLASPEAAGGALDLTLSLGCAPAQDIPLDAARRVALLYPHFSVAPSAVRTPRRPVARLLRGRIDAFVVFAPSDVEFDLDAGSWRIEARFGVVPASFEAVAATAVRFGIGIAPDGTGASDAADALEWATWRRTLDPEHQLADRGEQTVSVELDLDRPITLRCATRSTTDVTSWCYWSSIQLHRGR